MLCRPAEVGAGNRDHCGAATRGAISTVWAIRSPGVGLLFLVLGPILVLLIRALVQVDVCVLVTLVRFLLSFLRGAIFLFV